MTSADILVIVLCVVVVAAVAASALIRKIKGKPSACCADCAKCTECASRNVARDAQNEEEKTIENSVAASENATCGKHSDKCAHGCVGCRGCTGYQVHRTDKI